mgnify:FL=1
MADSSTARPARPVENNLLWHVYQMYIPVLSPCRQKCVGQQDEFREDAQEVYSGSKCLSLPFIVPFREMRVGNFMQHHQQAEKTAEYVSSICHLSISVIHFRAVPNKTIAGIRSK